MSRKELVERIHELEEDVSDLEEAFEAFRRQVRQKLE
jgi:exonuclease VII small subunit